MKSIGSILVECDNRLDVYKKDWDMLKDDDLDGKQKLIHDYYVQEHEKWKETFLGI